MKRVSIYSTSECSWCELPDHSGITVYGKNVKEITDCLDSLYGNGEVFLSNINSDNYHDCVYNR